MSKTSKAAVLVTTEHRGVFFGYTSDDPRAVASSRIITLKRARNCVYWSAAVKGFLGLCSRGPTTDCKVGPPANITLNGVTSLSEVEPDAVDKWESHAWSR